jgi:hypothetical protein
VLAIVPVFLWLTATIPARLPLPGEFDAGRHAALVRSTIDPNQAPWWELAALPGIGPTKAKRIVRYREGQPDSARAFLQPNDLARVHGIGPKTVGGAAPWLCLPR